MYISWDAPRKQSGKALGSQVWGAPIGKAPGFHFASHNRFSRFSTLGPGSKPKTNSESWEIPSLLNFDDVTYSVTGVPIKSR